MTAMYRAVKKKKSETVTPLNCDCLTYWTCSVVDEAGVVTTGAVLSAVLLVAGGDKVVSSWAAIK